MKKFITSSLVALSMLGCQEQNKTKIHDGVYGENTELAKELYDVFEECACKEIEYAHPKGHGYALNGVRGMDKTLFTIKKQPDRYSVNYFYDYAKEASGGANRDNEKIHVELDMNIDDDGRYKGYLKGRASGDPEVGNGKYIPRQGEIMDDILEVLHTNRYVYDGMPSQAE